LIPLHLAAAVWLWSGLALAVPLVLHLLGRGRGVARRWPSVVLLREAALSAGARFRPSQPWLLLLRCALLAAVTLALAEPSAARHAQGGVVRLVEPGLAAAESGKAAPNANAANAAERAEDAPGAAAPRSGPAGERAADSKGNVEVRLLAPGLPVAGQAPSRTASQAAGRVAGAPEKTAGREGSEPDLWSLLAEADAVLPAGASFEVVARPRLAALRGARPWLGRSLAWRSPAAARGSSGQNGALAGGQRVRLWIAAAPERAGDAVTLRDGLAQGAAVLGWAMEAAPAAEAADLLASLGREAPAGWMARVGRGATLLRDGGGDLAPCVSLVATGSGGLMARTLCGGEPAGLPVWRDGAGRTALAREPSAGRGPRGATDRRFAGAVLRYAGRFSPLGGAWGRGAFAALLREARAAGGVPHEGMPFDAAGTETSIAQALPERGAGTSGAEARQPLEAPLWLLAGCLFGAERWLAARNRRRPAAEEA
jgi:hypothetical protein